MKLLISIVLILAIAMVYLFDSDSLTNTQQLSKDLQLAYKQDNENVKNLKNFNLYNAIVERPLFIEDRQFAKEEKVKVITKPRPVIDNLKVKALGIALTSDGILAVLKDLKNGDSLRLRIGEEIYGWRLDGVSESSFTFSRGGKVKVIAFKE